MAKSSFGRLRGSPRPPVAPEPIVGVPKSSCVNGLCGGAAERVRLSCFFLAPLLLAAGTERSPADVTGTLRVRVSSLPPVGKKFVLISVGRYDVLFNMGIGRTGRLPFRLYRFDLLSENESFVINVKDNSSASS